MQRYAAGLLLFFLILLPILGRAGPMLPFSHLINWEDREQAKRYDEILRQSGVTTAQAPLVRKDDTAKMAEDEHCILFSREGILVGKGVMLRNVFLLGSGSDGKKTIQFKLFSVEAIADNGGNSAVLVTYRAILSWWEELVAEHFGHQVSDYRRAIVGDDLGNNFTIDNASKKLLGVFVAMLQYC